MKCTMCTELKTTSGWNLVLDMGRMTEMKTTIYISRGDTGETQADEGQNEEGGLPVVKPVTANEVQDQNNKRYQQTGKFHT